jgi:hypothetical protein
VKRIKQRLGCERWRGFGFETLVRDIRKNANIEALKKAKKDLKRIHQTQAMQIIKI